MAYLIEKIEGKMKKNFGKLTGNHGLQIRGAIQENKAKLKDRWSI